MSQPSLREFQRWMKSRIRPEAPAAADDGPLNPQRGTPGRERLRVYAGGYVARTREALAEVYEAVRQVLGEQAFTELAEGYAAAHPSHDYNLSLSGRHLPAFLAGWTRTAELPLLPDLARLEWLICQAFHAFEQPPMDPQRVAAVPADTWDRLVLSFQPSVGLAASAWPILDVWQARAQPRDTIHIDLINRPQQVLVYRRDLQVVCEPIEAAQHAVLRGLQEGRSLGAVCEALAARSDEAAPVAAWCARWMALGLVTGARAA